VNTNSANPIIGTRALSDTPERAGRMGKAVIAGIQETGVIPVGKHFPGHGDTDRDSHLELPYVNRDADSLEKIELEPFAQTIDHGLKVVMTAHVIYSAWDDKLPATFSPIILKSILREKLGFDGLVKNITFESIPRLGSIAGVDLYLICHDRKKTLSLQNQMIQDIKRGHIDKKLIEHSAQKIIEFKKQIPSTPHGRENLSNLAKDHINLIREMKSHLL